MPYRGFEDLDVWKRSKKLAVDIYAAFRSSNDWGLKNQITRSAVSVLSNIAEGHERGTTKEFIRFLYIAKGSTAELRTQLSIASEVGEINAETVTRLIDEARQINAMLQSLIRSTETRAGEEAAGYELLDFVSEARKLATEN
ncbi:four helix bundle protein [Wenzhouxiangella sp. XN79A]|uniref:four helix bundle protein n=1 Tax=Wenzhouxiangella sp. XN79A TaxID=2724193 RepID=UPI00144AC7A3|nr:four helix bundle protein [Wenzhouxiangella sp. XN79A]NKI36421.1 four helix bundle protein [Wenzhouxiangella sp. XN79A]